MRGGLVGWGPGWARATGYEAGIDEAHARLRRGGVMSIGMERGGCGGGQETRARLRQMCQFT